MYGTMNAKNQVAKASETTANDCVLALKRYVDSSAVMTHATEVIVRICHAIRTFLCFVSDQASIVISMHFGLHQDGDSIQAARARHVVKCTDDGHDNDISNNTS